MSDQNTLYDQYSLADSGGEPPEGGLGGFGGLEDDISLGPADEAADTRAPPATLGPPPGESGMGGGFGFGGGGEPADDIGIGGFGGGGGGGGMRDDNPPATFGAPASGGVGGGRGSPPDADLEDLRRGARDVGGVVRQGAGAAVGAAAAAASGARAVADSVFGEDDEPDRPQGSSPMASSRPDTPSASSRPDADSGSEAAEGYNK